MLLWNTPPRLAGRLCGPCQSFPGLRLSKASTREAWAVEDRPPGGPAAPRHAPGAASLSGSATRAGQAGARGWESLVVPERAVTCMGGGLGETLRWKSCSGKLQPRLSAKRLRRPPPPGSTSMPWWSHPFPPTRRAFPSKEARRFNLFVFDAAPPSTRSQSTLAPSSAWSWWAERPKSNRRCRRFSREGLRVMRVPGESMPAANGVSRMSGLRPKNLRTDITPLPSTTVANAAFRLTSGRTYRAEVAPMLDLHDPPGKWARSLYFRERRAATLLIHVNLLRDDLTDCCVSRLLCTVRN